MHCNGGAVWATILGCTAVGGTGIGWGGGGAVVGCTAVRGAGIGWGVYTGVRCIRRGRNGVGVKLGMHCWGVQVGRGYTGGALY